MKQLDELVAIAATSDSALEAALVALRAAGNAFSDLQATAATVQREAHEAEFEEIPVGLRGHLDGRLLQRTRYVSDTAAQLSSRIRDLAQGVRDLKADCAAVAELAAPPAEPVASASSAT